MGKKHLQPQPIDIFNAPSPRTLLTTGGVPMKRSRDSSQSIIGQALKKPTGSSGQSIITTGGSIIVTPTGSASAFPESPPPETIEDYGDIAQDRAGRSRSADSDDFSSEGDDGNPNHDSSDSLGSDDEEDYDSNEEIEGEEEGEEGEEAVEEESDNEEYEDDDEDATHVNVDFEAVEMDEDDINSVMHLMDQLIPDHLNEVDRDGFGLLLASEPKTTLIQLPPESSAPPTALSNATSGEVEVYGIVSLLNLGAAATSSVVSALAQKVLRGQLWSVVHPGIAPYDILTSKNEAGDSKALLLVSEHIRNVPMEVVSKTLAVTLESLDEEDAEAKKKNSKQQKRLMRAAGPSCMFVILAKIQRDAEKAAAITKKEKKAAGPSAKQKRRTEGGSGSGGGDHAVTLNIEDDFIFWREEDNILYNLRDKRVAVHAHRCRPQYDMQPESERPVTLSFAVTMEGLRRAMTTIETKIATS